MTAHDLPDVTPGWYKAQPRSPVTVYEADVIRDIQRTLSVPETGVWDALTVSHVKGLQAVLELPQTGVIDEQTAVQIERLRNRYV